MPWKCLKSADVCGRGQHVGHITRGERNEDLSFMNLTRLINGGHSPAMVKHFNRRGNIYVF